MLYYWLKYMMRFALTVFYRRRVFTGWDQVPASGPVIFACNHPNSFLDAMIIGAFIKRETHFLARSDVFNTPLKLWILSQFKMMPIYRLSEGKEDLGKNQETFEKCHEVFRKGGAILMFSEGLCIQEMRLRPLKKGTARIAMEYSKDGSPLTIIPTGLNYMKPTKFREDLLIQMDTPFNAADFAAEYNESQAKGIQSFNNRLREGLQNSVIDIRDKKNEKAIEQLVEIEYNNGADLKKLIEVVKPTFSEEELALLAEYRATLEKTRIRDEVVAGKKYNLLLRLPAMAALALVFWLYLIPILPAIYIARNKIRLVEFKDSVFIGASVVFVFLFWLATVIPVSIVAGAIVGAQLFLAFLLAAFVAGPGYEGFLNLFQNSRLHTSQDRTTLESLRKKISVLHLVKPHQSHHPVG